MPAPSKEQADQVRYQIEVQQAFLEGKTIALQSRATGGDWTVVFNPTWNWYEFDYKVEEPLMELWINIYDYGVLCCHYTQKSAEESTTNRHGIIRTVHMREVRE